MRSPATDPTRPSGQPQELLPAPVAALRPRRRPDLTISIPQRDSSLALPPPSTASSSVPYSSPSSVPASTSSPSQKTPQLSDLDRLRCIASSPGGTVWTVRDHPTGRHYVLKSIRVDHDDALRRKIRREIELRRSFDSHFVVRCHGVYDQGGKIQVLLEYMDGGSLEGRRIASEPSLADVAHQVLHGLAYLHDRKIVHRDISPSSLLIDTANQVKIADFGLFSRIFKQTLSIAYMSPERISTDLDFGKIYDGYSGDVWSFGLSILEIYLGRFPFGEDVGKHGDWASLIHAICYSDPPAAPPTASPELRSFISGCLQKEPSSRPTAAQLLQHPFIMRAQVTTPPLHPPPPSP